MAGNAYLTIVAGIQTLVRGIQASLGGASAGAIPALNANGQLDQSFFPSGIGPDTVVINATEALAAGAFVNIWANSGNFGVRNADGSTTGKQADGFVLAAVASGSPATVYFNGNNNSVSGLTPGPQYLSDTSIGQATATPPTAAGHTLQLLGPAGSATDLNFTKTPPITLG